MDKKNFNIVFGLFILFSILIFIEGFFYSFSYKLAFYFEYFDPTRTGFNPLIWNENRIIEILQVVFLLISILNFIYIIKKIKYLEFRLFLKLFIYLYFVSLLYFFFEEISWGQHLFGWDSNSFFITHNKQNETNIHNISNLFNELPRGILTIWCSTSFIFIKIIPNKKNFSFLNKFIMPSYKLKYVSIYLLFFFVPDFFVDKAGLHPGNTEHSFQYIVLSDVLNFITFNFIKLSEYQELIFAFYILLHSFFFKKFIFLTDKEKRSRIEQ